MKVHLRQIPEGGTLHLEGEENAGPLGLEEAGAQAVGPLRYSLDVGLSEGGIFVTGRLGGSLHGHHLTFTPRLIQARWLAANITVHAMMDLSDGLARDLPRMAGASGVDYVIDEDTLPLQDGCSRQQAWSDGEDYELLFAVPAHALKLLGRAWSRLFQSLPLTRIGTFVLKGEGRPVSFESAGWEHFSPPHPP